MTGVGVARWDLEWLRGGGGWTATLVRRDQAKVALGLALPVAIELRPIDASISTPATLSVPGTLAGDHKSAVIDVLPAQVDALPLPRYWHVIRVGDPARPDRPFILVTGYVSIVDTVYGG